jgi:hypothetical protein
VRAVAGVVDAGTFLALARACSASEADAARRLPGHVLARQDDHSERASNVSHEKFDRVACR